MNQKLIVGIVLIVLIVGGAIVYTQSNKSVNSTPSNETITTQPSSAPSSAPDATTSETNGEVKTFTIESENFAYSMKEIKVKKGDRVKIVLVNKQGFHDWVVDEFTGAKTKQIGAGATETIEFTADKVGTFQFYCSVGNHRAMGMVGNLIVE